MADLKISQLTGATTPLAGTEVVPVVQSGTTKKVSVANLTAGRVVGMLRNNIEGVYDAAAPSTSSVPILRVNEGGAVSLWVSGQGYSNVWLQAIQDDGSNNLKPLYLQPLGGDIYTGANIVPQVAAQGVNFTANTPAAGKTSQLLNWYEEGTWTATLIGTTAAPTTPVTVTGLYTRVGRQVTVYASFVAVNTTGATGDVRVTGLPFTVGSQASIGASMTNGLGSVATVCTAEAGTTYINVRDGSTTVLLPMVAGANKYLTLQVTYSV